MTGWEALILDAFDDPAGRIVELSVRERTLEGQSLGEVTLQFGVEDLRGASYVASAKMYVPAALLGVAGSRAAVWFSCGYELNERHVPQHVRQGRIVVTSCDPADGEVFPGSNPMSRGPNTDIVLAHLVRGCAFVDPRAIAYNGGSAGGYAALMVAAESFPVPVVTANVPPLNLTYQAAYVLSNYPRLAAHPPEGQPLVGVLTSLFVDMLTKVTMQAYGDDLSAPGWYAHSPLAHLDRMTGPVATCHSSADFLVPVEQVSAQLGGAGAPAGIVKDAASLTSAEAAARTLLEALDEDVELRVLAVPPGAARSRLEDLDITMSKPQTAIPVPATTHGGQRWLAAIVDEGPVITGIGHTVHEIQPDFEPFVAAALAIGIEVAQLTQAKLEQLVDRWTGREWLALGFRRLDHPDAERADVERGLRLYCATSPDHLARFLELYGLLPEQRRVLPADFVDDLAL